MSAASVQRAIARLVVDASARRAFLAGDETALSSYPLSPEELVGFAQLRTHGRAGLELSAAHLSGRRARQVAAALPLSKVLLGAQVWAETWSTYSETSQEEPLPSPSAIASRFAVLLAAQAMKRDPLAAEVVRYEGCKASVRAAPRLPRPDAVSDPLTSVAIWEAYPLIHPLWTHELFEFDLLAAVPVLRTTGVLPRVAPMRTPVLFYRSWISGKVATARVSPELVAVLERCDGRHQCREFVDRRVSDDAEPWALTRLAQTGVLVFARSASRPDGSDAR